MLRITDKRQTSRGTRAEYWPSIVYWDLLGYQMVAWPTWREQAQHWASAFLGELGDQKTCLVLDLCQAANQCSLESMEKHLLISVHPSVSLQCKDMQHPPWKWFTIVPSFHLLFSGLFFSPVSTEQTQICSSLVFSSFFPCRIADLSSGVGVGRLISVADPIPHWMKWKHIQHDICLCLRWRPWSQISEVKWYTPVSCYD